MTDNTQNLDEQISDILAAIYLAGTENGLGRQLTDPAEIMHRKEAFINANPASTEAKQALLDWHNEQIAKARLNEAQIFYEDAINSTSHSHMIYASRRIERHLDTLKEHKERDDE